MPIETIQNGIVGLSPVIVFLALLLQFDAFKLVRLSFVLKLIAAGIGVALAAYFLSPILMDRLGADYFFYMRFVGPVVEEILKASIVLFLIRANKIGFAMDAVIAGFAIGAGFALLENYYYLFAVGETQTAVWVVRGFGTAIMHGGVTALFAVITQLITPQQKTARLPYHAIPGLAAAIILHAVYNQFILEPVMSAIVVMTGLAFMLGFILHRGQQSIDTLLQVDFARYHALLDEIRSGEFGEHKTGKLLKSLRIRLDPSETAEINRYVELHTELVLFGEQVIDAQARGEPLEITDAIREKLAQFNYLDERVGRSVRMLLKDHIQFSRNEFFQLYKLSRDAGKPVHLRHNFNSDILFDEADREAARSEFPSLYFALDHPALRRAFGPYDERANKAKRKSKRWGAYAIAIAAGALLLASAQPLYSGLPLTQLKLISALASLALLAGVIIGVFGLNYRGRKRRWLADRLATERIRGFHFRHYIDSARHILDAAEDANARQDYLQERDARFDRFQLSELDCIDEKLHQAIRDEEDLAASNQRSEQPLPPEGAAHLDEYFRAYARLRFEPQLNYCNHVLRESKSIWRPSALRQIKILSAIFLYGLLGILIFQQLVLIGVYADIQWMKAPIIHVLTIWAAFIALASRIFQEGFQPKRELERMRQYRLSLRRIHENFRGASSVTGKITAMLEMEKMSEEEVILFLKGNYEADFIA
ncbi:MAG: PrsW family glutamic-type intramembrane protease [Pseudomonadota bacterium]